MIWLSADGHSLIPRPTPRGTALVDATTIVLAGELLAGTPPTAMGVSALANLVDGLVLYGKIATRRPPYDPGGRFAQALASTGLEPDYVDWGEDDVHTSIHNIQTRFGGKLSFVEIDEAGHSFIPDGSDDPAWGELCRSMLRPRPPRTKFSPDDLRPPPSHPSDVFNSEGLEVWASFYHSLQFDRTRYYYVRDEEGPLAGKEEYHGRPMPPGIAFLAYRAHFYMLLSARTGLPYLPDCARSFLMSNLCDWFNERTADATKAAIRRVEGADIAYSRRLAGLLSLPIPPLRVPLLLTSVMAASSRPDEILVRARELGATAAASGFRKYVDRLNDFIVGDDRDLNEARAMMERLVVASEEFNRKAGAPTLPDGSLPTDGHIVGKAALSVGSNVLFAHVDPATAVSFILQAGGDVASSMCFRLTGASTGAE